jgi:hypothetical protein
MNSTVVVSPFSDQGAEIVKASARLTKSSAPPDDVIRQAVRFEGNAEVLVPQSSTNVKGPGQSSSKNGRIRFD